MSDSLRRVSVEPTAGEPPAVVRDRAAALVDYLLAVRAQLERPARTVPAADAHWLDQLPAHPDCRLGPAPDGATWLRVGLPRPPAPLAAPRGLDLAAVVTAADEPKLADPAGADPPTVARFEAWREEQWRPWAAAADATARTRRLHRELFDLKHRLDMGAATTELVWGHGLLRLPIGEHRVHYPLLVTPVALTYEPDTSVIAVAPQGPTRLQTDPLSGLDDRFLAQLLALGGPGGTVAVDPFDDLERRELFERALRRLGHDPVLRAPGEPGDGIVDTGVLFARPRQRMLRRFLEQFRDRLQTDAGTETIGSLAAILAHEPSRLRMPGDDPDAWRPVGERLLMPLPANEAQESIARRLAGHRNVAVQGPPGTGKTHTIRNLICHLMAHGKRVLVVAQKEDPLRVLRDGLPAEVQPLCLAVLGRTADQLGQLQVAARELSDRAATLDKAAEHGRVDRLTGQLEEAERDLAGGLAALRALAENEAATYVLDGVTLSPAEVGAWLRAGAAESGFIPDPVAGPPPLTADEFGALLGLARGLAPADRSAAVQHLPGDLPSAAELGARRESAAAADAEIAALEAAGVDTGAVRDLGRDGLTDLLAGLRDAAAWQERRAGTWTDRLGRLVADPYWAGLWAEHAAATRQVLDELAGLTRQLAGHRVAVPAAWLGEPRRALAELDELRRRFAAGKGVSRLLQAGLHRLATETRVDDEPLRTAADVDLAAAQVRRAQARRRLAEHWAEWAQRLDIGEQHGEADLWAGTLLAEAERSLGFDANEWPDLAARLRLLVPQRELDLDAGRLAAVAALLDRAAAVFGRDDLAAADRALAAELGRGDTALLRRLDRAAGDLADWDDAVAEARRLAALRPDVVRYLGLRDRLAAHAPQWAAALDAGAVPPASGAGCLSAWGWRQAQTWFDGVVGHVDPAVLGRRVERARERIRRLTSELVVASAWLAVAHGLDDRRRAALADWTTALRKIGKGTGRNAAAWQAHAQRAMAQAVEAVPVWVMSVDRAIEQFAGGARFDVVIVDEASQADLFALPVLSLAERAVVVGDDQQIGPQLGFVGNVTGLIDAHLTDVPSAEHFDPEGSLYDHAVRRSPERILLTEHFRCVPQIIEFSSRHYYDGRIEPLRSSRAYDDPVRSVHVPDGVRQSLPAYGDVNVAEADALVATVTALVADAAYDGKSLGVISLLSTSGQALYLLAKLREAIGEDEMEARRLRVGDAYTFQGDERDVVLVSMVASANDPALAAFTKREYHRRVNVAASRARDQLWVFHSLQAADLRPDDARGLLLNYCANVTVPVPSADLAARCESDFERAVLRALTARGYAPVPQFRIGGYRIDFVLPAPDGRRLAIECDGDAYHGPEQWESDMRRQAVLERVGNCVFVRIRGSIFAREPSVALAPLWRRLDELDIRP
jgi:very-short-patch-repair endonuclease